MAHFIPKRSEKEVISMRISTDKLAVIDGKAAQYGIRPASTDEILADPEVELVVILTPPSTHYDLVKGGVVNVD